MAEFIVTFGQKYRNEPHPKVKYADPDGYLLILSPDYKTAREAAFRELGEHFSNMYEKEEKYTRYFPKGALHTISTYHP